MRAGRGCRPGRRCGCGSPTSSRTYEIPALQQGGLKPVNDPVAISCSRSGYTPELLERAGEEGNVALIDTVA